MTTVVAELQGIAHEAMPHLENIEILECSASTILSS